MNAYAHLLKRLGFLPMVAGLAALAGHGDEPAAPAASGWTSTLVSQRVEADFEALLAADMELLQTGLAYVQKHGRFEWTASLAYNEFGLEYRPAPFDFLGAGAELNERRIAGQINGRVRLGDSVSVLAGGGAYDGFSNYRTVWLNEYFRQQFSALPEYVPASPRGKNVNLGLRWEYLPASAFIEANVSYLHDEIAPGYEIDFAGLRRGRPKLETLAYQVALENVLTRRVRLRHEFRLTDQTDRELRYAYQGALNVALGNRWVVRLLGGYTEEAPTFAAHYFGGAVEFEPAAGWTLGVFGRSYRDSGEIENTLFSSAAPGLAAWQAGLSLSRTWGVHSFRLSAAPYVTRFEPAGIGTAFFQNLYRNRDWALLQVAYAAEF